MAKQKLTLKRKVTSDGASYRGPAVDGVSASLLSAFGECRVACRLGIEGWRAALPKRALQLGSLMHEAIEGWTADGCPKGLTAATLVSAMGTAWRVKALKAGDDAKAVETDLFTVSALMEGYAKRWGAEDRKRKWLGVEKAFDVLWEGWRLRGKRDGVYRAADGSLWVKEIKTRSHLAESMTLALTFDLQSMLYVLATEAEMGERVSGVLYDVVRKPQLRVSKGESVEMYRDRVLEDVRKRPDHYFMRWPIAYGRAQLKRFCAQLHVKLNVMQRWVEQGMVETYRSEGNCISKWDCAYLRACATGTMLGYAQTYRLFQETEE